MGSILLTKKLNITWSYCVWLQNDHVPVFPSLHRGQIQKTGEAMRGKEREAWELWCLLTFFNPALPPSLPASGARSCREDVNWGWNNKQSEPLWHPETTKEEAAEGTWISPADLGLDWSPISLILRVAMQPRSIQCMVYTHVLLQIHFMLNKSAFFPARPCWVVESEYTNLLLNKKKQQINMRDLYQWST